MAGHGLVLHHQLRLLLLTGRRILLHYGLLNRPMEVVVAEGRVVWFTVHLPRKLRAGFFQAYWASIVLLLTHLLFVLFLGAWGDEGRRAFDSLTMAMSILSERLLFLRQLSKHFTIIAPFDLTSFFWLLAAEVSLTLFWCTSPIIKESAIDIFSILVEEDVASGLRLVSAHAFICILMEKDKLVTSIDVNWIGARYALRLALSVITLLICLLSLLLDDQSISLLQLLLVGGRDSVLCSVQTLLHLLLSYVTLPLIIGQVLHPLKDFIVLLAQLRLLRWSLHLGCWRRTLLDFLDSTIEPILYVLQSLLTALSIIDKFVQAGGGRRILWLINRRVSDSIAR